MRSCDLCGKEDARCNVYSTATPTPIICGECFDEYQDSLRYMIARSKEWGLHTLNPVQLHLTEVYCYTIHEGLNRKRPEMTGREMSDLLARTVLGTTRERRSSPGRGC